MNIQPLTNVKNCLNYGLVKTDFIGMMFVYDDLTMER